MNFDSPSLISVLREKPQPETLELVDSALKSLVASLFRVSFLQVTSETSLSSYGLDSLRAMELKNLIQSEIGVELPATVLLSGATLRAVAEAITQQVYVGEDVPALTPSADERGTQSLALSLAQERYRVGANTFLDVTQSRAEYERAQTDLINAIYEFHRSFAALENAVGRPLR